jgi:hydrogenase nickel incorporation protein HypA/HybF
MHELSIVLSIVDIAEEEAQKAGVDNFSKIVLEIGSQSGIVLEALHFAWSSGVKDSVLSKAKLEVSQIQAIARCEECQHEFNAETLYDSCPRCNDAFTELISGKELKIKSLELE